MKNANVIVYDSDQQFVEHLADRLSGLGIACTVCRTLDEIEALLCTGDVDVLIFGSQEVGAAVMRFLTRLSRYDDAAQVILMVRKDQMRLSIEGMKNGAFDDIYIPFALDALLGKLSLALQQRRLLQRSSDV